MKENIIVQEDKESVKVEKIKLKNSNDLKPIVDEIEKMILIDRDNIDHDNINKKKIEWTPYDDFFNQNYLIKKMKIGNLIN